MVLISKMTFSRKISVSFSSGELNLKDNEELEVFWIIISHPSGYCVLIPETGLSYIVRLPFERDWTELSVMVVGIVAAAVPLSVDYWYYC